MPYESPMSSLTALAAPCYECAALEARIAQKPTKDAVHTTRSFFRAASLASVGLEMGVAVFVGFWIGQFLDKELGTTPWLMILFLLFGVAAAFKAIIRTAKQALHYLVMVKETLGDLVLTWSFPLSWSSSNS